MAHETKTIKNSGLELTVLVDTPEIFKDLSPEGVTMALEAAENRIASNNLEVKATDHPIIQNRLLEVSVALEAVESGKTEKQAQEDAQVLATVTDDKGQLEAPKPISKPKYEALWRNEGTSVATCSSLQEIQERSGLSFQVEKGLVGDILSDVDLETSLQNVGFSDERISALAEEMGLQTLKGMLPSREVPNQYQIRRADNGHILTGHTVTGRYTVCQNETILQVLDDLREKGKIEFDTAGCTGYGKRIFYTAKLTGLPELDVNDKKDLPPDLIQPYLSFWSSHDGSLPLVAKFISFRPACGNMASAGYNNKGIRINIPHTKSINDRVSEAAEVLLKVRENWEHTASMYKRLKALKLDDNKVLKLIPQILGIKLDKDASDPIAALHARQQGRIREIEELYRSEYFNHFGESAFDLLQAFTAFNTHRMNLRNNNSRFESLSLGTGFELEDKAFTTLSKVVEMSAL